VFFGDQANPLYFEGAVFGLCGNGYILLWALFRFGEFTLNVSARRDS
jgi:hypothetical protein